MMPQLAEDSATGAGRIATRRLDADDQVRVSTVRFILTERRPRPDRGRHDATGRGFRVSRRHANPREAVSPPPHKTHIINECDYFHNLGKPGFPGKTVPFPQVRFSTRSVG